jgi:hypothetical protein
MKLKMPAGTSEDLSTRKSHSWIMDGKAAPKSVKSIIGKLRSSCMEYILAWVSRSTMLFRKLRP